MKLAVISDVHGNLPAFEAVLTDIDKQHVDLVVNLGDLFSGGVAPGRTADRMIALNHLVIRGNHERQLLESPPGSLSLSDRLALSQLSQEHLSWMAGLPNSAEPAEGVLAVHGSPRSDTEYLLETVEPAGARRASSDEIAERLGSNLPTQVLLCGHTHLARVLKVQSGMMIVNPGSVGWPAYSDHAPYPHVMESGSPHARYAIIERCGQSWDVTLRLVAYDWDAAAQIALANGRLDVAASLTTGLVRR